MRSILKGFLICLLLLGIGSSHLSLLAETSTAIQQATPTADVSTPAETPIPTEYFTPTMTPVQTYTVTVAPTEIYTSTVEPTVIPTEAYTDTVEPTMVPTEVYTSTVEPTMIPTVAYTDTVEPTMAPTEVYTGTVEPTMVPTEVYTGTVEPTMTPTEVYTSTVEPTMVPTEVYTSTVEPTMVPTEVYTGTVEPTVTPTGMPSPTATPMATAVPYENPTIYIDPAEAILAAGDTYTFSVNIAPGATGVNGAQVHGRVDPTYLRILNIEAVTSQLPVNVPPSFTDSTGVFSYSANLLTGISINRDFEILQVQVEALAATEGTPIELLTGLENFPPTDVTDGSGSVMDAAINGTVIIDDSATMIGEVGLQGRPRGSSDAKIVPVTIELYPSGEITPTLTFSVTLDENGGFVRRNIDPGTYDVRLVSDHTLFSNVANVSLIAGDNNVYLRTLREGDITRDNIVKQDDLGIFSGAYNRCKGQEGFNDLTDLNEDECTESNDFGLLSGNFNTLGDVMYDFREPEVLSTNLVLARIQMELGDISNKAVGDSFDVTISVDPNGSKVNGTTAHIVFDSTKLEATNVELLAAGQLPLELQAPQIEAGSVHFSKGLAGNTVTEKFELAKITLKIKEENDGSSLGFTRDVFPPTNVVGTEGSVLAAAVDGAGQEEKFVTGSVLYLPFISR